MSIDELYKQYGQLMVQKELLDNRINNVKRLINEEMRKPKQEVKKEK